jgi:hypothetical protein
VLEKILPITLRYGRNLQNDVSSRAKSRDSVELL